VYKTNADDSTIASRKGWFKICSIW
jgi:hypothetical protein